MALERSRRENACEPQPRHLRATDIFFEKLADSFLEPLARLTGMRLWLVAEDKEALSCNASFCHSLECHPERQQACVDTLTVLRREAGHVQAPRCTVCASGFGLFSVPIVIATAVAGFIEGRTAEPMGASSAETMPGLQLAPAIALLQGIVHSLLATAGEPAITLEAVTPVQKAKLYIRRNLSEKLALAEVARAVDLSESYFSKLFRQSEGVSMSNYVIRERVAYACNQLLQTNKNISEIAFAAGFESISHFNRSFKVYTNAAPKRYRVEHRQLSGGGDENR